MNKRTRTLDELLQFVEDHKDEVSFTEYLEIKEGLLKMKKESEEIENAINDIIKRSKEK